jgi:acyl dehydratase
MHRRHPIHPGDTLTGRSTIIRARNSENPRYEGITPGHTRFHYQRDKLVVDYRWTHVVAKQKRSIDG